LTSVFDFKQKLLTTSLAIYNGSIDFLWAQNIEIIDIECVFEHESLIYQWPL
jgi:hypothetical protein